MNDIYIHLLSQTLKLPKKGIKNTIQLFNDGATVPFIARYRKEMTGSLDEVAITEIKKGLQQLTDLDKRKGTILKAIEEQGKLTNELKKQIEETFDMTTLEDIYLPYKKKRKTRASVARENGLEPLAQLIFTQKKQAFQQLIPSYLNENLTSPEEVLQGSRDIIAEWVNENEKARNAIRHLFRQSAAIRSKMVKGKEAEGKKFKDYFDFEEPLKKCPSHRLLAIRRGEEEGFLSASISIETDRAVYRLEQIFLDGRGPASEQVQLAIKDSYKRLLAPAIETEFRNLSKEKADIEAISVFAENLKQLLLTAPLGQKRILAIDPGFRTGCKVVCLDQNGSLLENTTIFPHPPQSKTAEAIYHLKGLIDKYNIAAIAIGNGTAGRETLSLFDQDQFGNSPDVYMVNESGASIYSASKIARQEFPDHDVTVRGAVSIGRRLMDPLAELVKIDPKSIGVGQYQHDVHQGQLKESLNQVVESCVNQVGINLNTASQHILTYISGLGPTLAENIIQYRNENGAFSNRKQLKKVPRMGAKAFEQCAGFLRIRSGTTPLDNTAVHPESYAIVDQMSKDQNCTLEELISNKKLQKEIDLRKYVTDQVGLPTLKDIVGELEKPGLDPRGQARPFEFAQSVRSIEDLSIGMILPGIVTNITNFGAFVDIGVKQDGLVHVSQLANKYVKNPLDVVRLQQEVQVKVMDVDLGRKRIHLSMKDV